MAEWSKNNRACKTTWFTLMVLNQHKEPFADAGALTMKELTFWRQATNDPTAREVAAKTLSIQLDNNFRLIRHAKFERGVTVGQATKDLRETLLDEDQTVAHLAACADNNYEFLGEKSDEI